jgi:PIN domain nuclease of toxin-antitoxin system
MIEIEHFNQLSSLPWHHRDPFDRLILSQCMMEKAHLVTHDKVFAEYSGVELLLV